MFFLTISISADKRANIPFAIQTFVNTTNKADTKGFVNSFTKDAYIRDWFHTYHGHEGVSSWNKSDNIGKNTHFAILSIKKTKVENEYILRVKVSGEGFNGVSDISFSLKENLIKKLIISPW